MVIWLPLTAWATKGNTVPSSTTRAKAPKRKLLAKNAPSRETGVLIEPGERSRSPRQARRPIEVATTTPKKESRAGPIPVLLNECTESRTPDRVRKVAKMVRLNVA